MSETTALTIPEMATKVAISPDWISLRDKVIKESEGLVVENETQYQAGSEILRRMTKLSNSLETFRKDFTKPFLAVQRSVKKMTDTARDPLENAKKKIKVPLDSYAEEQRRIEREERLKAEREAQEKAAEIARQNAEAEALMGANAPKEEIIETTAPVVARARSDSSMVVTSVVWEITDLDKVPRAFMMLDERAVNQYKREHKEMIEKLVEDGKPDGIVQGILFAIKTETRSR